MANFQAEYIEGIFRKSPIFSHVSDPGLRKLERFSYPKNFSRGTYLFFQEDLAENIYLVVHGLVQIILSSDDGRELVINEMVPGDCFGELAIITKQARSSGAMAKFDSQVIVIPGKTFLEVLDSEPALARSMLEQVARWLYQSNEREMALAFLNAEARLAKIVLQLDCESDDKGYVTISQEALASRASLTRQTAVKILGRWRRKGWIITGRGHMLVLNYPELIHLVKTVDT